MLGSAALAATLLLMTQATGASAARGETVAAAPTLPWQAGFENLDVEREYWVEDVEGTVPDALRGTLFRNGPGINRIAGQWLAHWFDGDGMLSKISFVGGRVHYRNRFVASSKHLEESKAGRILYRGFGTQRPGGVLANILRVPGNASNTSVVYHADRLLSLWEGGPPYRLNPADLSTVGIESFGGQVPVFSAHPRIDARTGELFNFGMQYGTVTRLLIFRIAPDGTLERFPAIKMPYPLMNHDFVLTGKYAVFCFGPILVNPIKLILGLASFDQTLAWDAARPTKILLVPRDRSKPPIWIDAEPFSQFHFANAYDDGDNVVIDLACYPNYATIGEEVRDFWKSEWPDRGSSRLTRITVEVADGRTESRELAHCPGAEFPRINPRQSGGIHRYVYLVSRPEGAAGGFYQVVNKIDTHTSRVTTHDFAPDGYVGEPVFIPSSGGKAEEDEGYIVTLVFDATTRRTRVVVLDARDLGGKPVVIARLTHHVPYGFHGFFTPQLFV